MELVQKSKAKLKKVTYNKILIRYGRLVEISESKIDQIANYIVTHLGEVTPLALEKLLSFCNGVNYAVNGKQLIFDESQAWAHGPVYPYIYNKYKKYGYKPIDNGIYSNHGWMVSKLSENEVGREVIDEKSMKEFYIEKDLCTEEKIMDYILNCIRNEPTAFLNTIGS